MTTQETLDAVAAIQARTMRRPSTVHPDIALSVQCTAAAYRYLSDNPHCTLSIHQLAAKLRTKSREMLVAG